MNLQNVPLALVGASFSVAAFPALAKDFTTGNTKEFLNTIGECCTTNYFSGQFLSLCFSLCFVHKLSELFWVQKRLPGMTRDLRLRLLAMFVISVTAQSLILAFYSSLLCNRAILEDGQSCINIVSSACYYFFSRHFALRVYARSILHLLQTLSIDVLHHWW
jgi:hypothetical protein